MGKWMNKQLKKKQGAAGRYYRFQYLSAAPPFISESLFCWLMGRFLVETTAADAFSRLNEPVQKQGTAWAMRWSRNGWESFVLNVKDRKMRVPLHDHFAVLLHSFEESKEWAQHGDAAPCFWTSANRKTHLVRILFPSETFPLMH